MEVEHVTGVCLTSRGTADQQGKGTVCYRVLGQVVVDDQDVLTLFSEIFRHSAARIGCHVLQGSRFRSGSGNHDGIFHGPRAGQLVYQLYHGGIFLSDGNVDTDHVGVSLIDDGIDGNFGLTRLAVADDQLTLTATDGDHTVDCLDSRLEGNRHALPLNDTGSFRFDGTGFCGSDGTLSVDGGA